MQSEEVIDAFDRLGSVIIELINSETTIGSNSKSYEYKKEFDAFVKSTSEINGWFTPENIYQKLKILTRNLRKDNLITLLKKNNSEIGRNNINPLKVAFVLEGASPLYGFYEMVITLLTGNIFIGRNTRKDNKLLAFLAGILIKDTKELSNRIFFENGFLKNFDAIVTTKSSSKKSDVVVDYLSKFKHHQIIKEHPVGILTGHETKNELVKLGRDVFTYFGRSTENIRKILLPEDYNFKLLFEAVESYSYVADYHKYFNSYEYYKSILLINTIEHLDNGFLLISDACHSVKGEGILEFTKYKNEYEFKELLNLVPKDSVLIGGKSSENTRFKFGEATELSLENIPYISKLFRFLSGN